MVHLHLSDDQGFRIAFDGYPELSEFSGNTKLTYASAYSTAGIVPSGGNNSGNALNRLAPGSIYYGAAPGILTKADFREIIDYAEARFVKIVPEIEIPTHAYAQKLALPLLNGVVSPLGQMPNASLTGTSAFWTETVGQSVSADPTGTSLYSKYTAAFIKDIYTQLCEMLPESMPYIHLGGDEPNNAALTTTIYNNMQKFAYEAVHAAGKKTWQWNAGHQNATSLATLDVIQNWSTNTNGTAATPTITANPNAKVIFSLAHQVYIDHRSSTSMPVGGSWANGTMAVATMFNIDPENAVAPAYRNQGYVIGVDSPCWSETYGTRQAMDILLWPRAICIAEVAWSPAETRSGTGATSAWTTSFQPRLAAQGTRLTYEDIFFANETSVWPAKSVTISSSITGTNTWANPGVTTPKDTPVSGKFTFSTAAPDTVVIQKCSKPSQGTVVLAADGSWTYTPNLGFMGKDSFTVGFRVDGYGMPLGPAASSGRGTAVYNGLRSVYINVTGTETTTASHISLLASRSTNVRVKFDPPVPSLINTNFTINNGVTVRMAETFDNGSTYLLVTTPRNEGNTTYRLTVNRSGANPAYTFNTVDLTFTSLTPKPEIFTLDSASFIIKPTTKFIVETAAAADLAAAKALADSLAATIRTSTGYGIDVVTTGTVGIRDISIKIINKIQNLDQNTDYATATDEGYALNIGVDGAYLTAYTPVGLLRGIRSILQLLPAEIQASSLVTGVDWVMTYASITDYQGSKVVLTAQDGEVTAEYNVFNPSESDERKVLCILAEYSEDGTLLSVKQEELSAAVYDLTTFKLTIPDGGHTVKAFLWDANTFVPLCAAGELN
jgi:N-acetyl-beta-hexosaminidase